jgi:hypothetical protein
MPVSAAAPVASDEPSANDAGAPAREPPTPVIAPSAPVEIGGAAGPDPTRFGDWEKHGRCIDF